MSLIKLTAISSPEVNGGKPTEVYVDANAVILITRGWERPAMHKRYDAHWRAMEGLYDEIERVNNEAKQALPTITPETEKEAQALNRAVRLREAAASLQTAYGMVRQATQGPLYYPAVECTVLSLSCGTALEHGVMLSRVFVTETPEQIAELVERHKRA